MTKYNNKPTTVDGYQFPSLAEAARYQELKLLERSGAIQNLAVHTRFVLQEAFQDASGRRWRALVYEADFDYSEGGRWVVEDVKGVATAVFRLKERIFRYRYPDIDLRIIEV